MYPFVAIFLTQDFRVSFLCVKFYQMLLSKIFVTDEIRYVLMRYNMKKLFLFQNTVQRFVDFMTFIPMDIVFLDHDTLKKTSVCFEIYRKKIWTKVNLYMNILLSLFL
jgi:hypothetical protein